MSLLDALLLDPYRINFWLAIRTDGVAGSGTQADPYNCKVDGTFDQWMNTILALSEVQTQGARIHLGPGVFKTQGYADNVTGGWQAKPRVKLIGSGIDVTTLYQIFPASVSGYPHFFAIGHPLTSTVDYFLVLETNLISPITIVLSAALHMS